MVKNIGMHAAAKPEIFRYAKELRRNLTESEIILWEYLKANPMGYKFRRQHPFSAYVLDFYCHKVRLSIEIDGGYHLSNKQKKLDQERTNNLNNLGITELRFKNESVIKNLQSVINSIESEVKKASRALNP